jgi:hypothetical protein
MNREWNEIEFQKYVIRTNKCTINSLMIYFNCTVSDTFQNIKLSSSGRLVHSLFSTTRTNCHTYTLLPPDDGLLASPNHVEVQWLNKLNINSAPSWFHYTQIVHSVLWYLFKHMCKQSGWSDQTHPDIDQSACMNTRTSLPEDGHLVVRNMLKTTLLNNNLNLLNTKHNLLYMSNQSVPRCKHFPPQLYKPISQCCTNQNPLSVLRSTQNTQHKASTM